MVTFDGKSHTVHTLSLFDHFSSTKKTLTAQSYLYHYMIAGDLVYLCITEEANVTQR